MISLLYDGVKTYLEHRKARKEREHQRDIKVIDNQARLAEDKESHNHHWEMAALKGSDKWLRQVSYSMISGPILIAFVSPEHAREIFEGLEQVPDWWIKTFVGVNGAVWGLSKLKEPLSQISHALMGKR